MSAIEEIAQKRQESQRLKTDQNLHQENLDAVTGSGDKVIEATNKLAKSDDIDSVIKQLKELQLSHLLEAQTRKVPKPEKPTIILTDQTDLGDRLTKLATDISDTVTRLDSSKSDSEQLAVLNSLKNSLDEYNKTLSGNNKTSTKNSADLLKAIKAINISPVVNVEPPKVTIKPEKIDTKPLEDTLKQYLMPAETEEKVDLSCYKAQDIDNTNPDVQYIGFVNTEGSWYIVENSIKDNKLRYLFGTSDYEKAFQKAAIYHYQLLNEAVDALYT